MGSRVWTSLLGPGCPVEGPNSVVREPQELGCLQEQMGHGRAVLLGCPA
ncbi:hypothetical protein TIFTF001_045096 [Ficus carica]|uniref:Uncharacterized protein n=1 Tax=Ficus carica TaxID=3494 RepID=A0AA87YNC6_FICCA|nr:hypothetical protein TIFTF001_045087 [Ficus carica]GMN18876.1 hypothetical protein TIFTF001_045090 [Ficus carica]GMN18887.1 hypothetical protein TIFTF001_045093 [Ficus carica]GMN18899.1 hypothetical protein TIFTF001_045096 [Ficus carica]